MELSYFLAQLLGLTLIIFAGIAMFRSAIITATIRDLRPYSFSMLLAGFAAIVAGLSIILTHNIWEFSWIGLITLFGWSALLKGVTYVAFPNFIIGTANKALVGRKSIKLWVVVMFVLGVYLTYKGFGA